MRAFSLLEVVLATALFFLFFIALFLVFELGTRTFYLSAVRHSLQTDSRRVSRLLDTDLRLTDSNSATVVNDGTRVVDGTLHRDAVCMAAVKDWSNPSLYDPSAAAPRWDHYLLYYATMDTPLGTLVRSVLEPAAAQVGGFAFAGFVNAPTDFLSDDPHRNATPQTSFKKLAEGVLALSVSNSSLTSGYHVSLQLQETTAATRGATGSNLKQVIQLDFDVIPENSKPRQ